MTRVDRVESALYEGTLQHRRREPAENSFRYGVYQLLLNLEELPELASRIPFFGYDRFNLTSFHATDHFQPDGRQLREKLSRWLDDQGRELPDGPVLLLTNVRVLGYVFNPVSYFYCLDGEHRIRLVVAEVSNTFGERYPYLLEADSSEGAPPGSGSGPAVMARRVQKAFHVSPFMDVDGNAYRWFIGSPGPELAVHMEVCDRDRAFFDATLRLERQPLTTRSLASALVRHPHMTARTIGQIHWQALKLWIKGVRVRSKPEPPEGTVR